MSPPLPRRRRARLPDESAMSSIDDEALHWVMREAGGELTPDERAAFDTWYAANPRHQGAYLRASAMQYSLGQLTVHDSMRPPLRPDSVCPGAALPARRRRNVAVAGVLAAGLAALAVVSLRPAGIERTTLVTAHGEFRKVPLADRSVVSMNSGTVLELAYTGNERRIVLARGEAWFEVAKDGSKPFIVESGDVRVRAVGTAFAVRRYPAGASVLVTEGAVDVWSEGGGARKTALVAGTRAFVPRQAQRIDVVDDSAAIERALAWRSGKLVFQNRSLADAVADFNRYNARQIVIADTALASKTLVGQYRLDQPEHFANDVRVLFRVKVALGPDRIIIGAPVVVGRTGTTP